MENETHALLLTDEPFTAWAVEQQLRSGGFQSEVFEHPSDLLARLWRGAATLCLVDLDTARPLPEAFAAAVLSAAAHWPACIVVAITAGTQTVTGWPSVVGKPFAGEQVHAWRAAAIARKPAACASPVSIDHVAATLGGTRVDALALLSDYSELVVPQHQLLRSALETGPPGFVAETAHRICGSLGSIGAHEAGIACRDLMNAARIGDTASVARLDPHVRGLLTAVEAALSAALRSDNMATEVRPAS